MRKKHEHVSIGFPRNASLWSEVEMHKTLHTQRNHRSNEYSFLTQLYLFVHVETNKNVLF